MGLPAYSLWDTIRHHEESVPIAQLAEEHHRRHGRPLRIAVDEADWRFNNLTAHQVYAIRDASNQQAFQGIEKAMFYRICRLLALNIQLVFVFDGPCRPWKSGKRGQGPIKYEERRLLQDMLKYFGIPYHEAPGEAEAECARMQILGMVDAVWSQDSDCLMFGCTLWLHDLRISKVQGNADRSKENTVKNGKYARVVRAQDLQQRHGLDREGLVLFAMLVGADYDVKGLPQCGPSVAMQAVKRGLGKSLCACLSEQDCRVWSAELAMFLQTTSRGRIISVPSTFPCFNTLQKYYNPKVTSDQVLLSSSRLNLGYERPIQELELLQLTSERFNIWGRLYMNWVGPVLLTRDLVARTSARPKEAVHGIRLTKQRAKTADGQPSIKTFERKLTFSPFGVTSLCQADFEGAKLGHWNGDKEVLFDKDHRVECEMPAYWLHNALPDDVLDPCHPTPKSPSERKRVVGDGGEVAQGSRNKRKCSSQQVTTPARSGSPQHDSRRPKPSTLLKSAFAEPFDSEEASKSKSKLEILDLTGLPESEDENMVGIPSGSRSRGQPAVVHAPSRIVDSGHLGPSSLPSLAVPRSRWANTPPFDLADEEDEELQLALRLSMQDHLSSQTCAPHKGRYDDVFAMREAGRDVQGLSVPAWSRDPTTHQTPMAAISRAPSHQVRHALQHRSNFAGRGVHANAIGADPLEDLFGLPSPTLFDGTMNLLPRPAEPNRHVAGPKADAQVSAHVPPADIRDARLRHFETCSTSTVADTKNATCHSTATRLGMHGLPSTKIPEDIECIDLTED